MLATWLELGEAGAGNQGSLAAAGRWEGGDRRPSGPALELLERLAERQASPPGTETGNPEEPAELGEHLPRSSHGREGAR